MHQRVDRQALGRRVRGPGAAGRVEDVLVTHVALQAQLAVLEARGAKPPGDDEAGAAAVADGVRMLLETARKAAAAEEPAPGRLSRFWTGRHLEVSYSALHQAQVQIVDLYPDPEVEAAVPGALNLTRRYLDRDDSRRAAAEKLPQLDGAELRAALKAARTAGYRARDLNHKQQRTFRNALVVATVVTGLLVVLLVGALARHPEFVSMCFDSVRQDGVASAPAPAGTPSVNLAADEQLVVSGRRTNCPTGAGAHQLPGQWDVALVTFLGMIGAAVAAAVTVRGTEVTTSPYDVQLAVSLFKIPLGALTAFIGLLAIKAGLVPGLSALDSPAQILAYAVLLGYGQQVVTTFLDRRAASLGRADAATRSTPDRRDPRPAPPG